MGALGGRLVKARLAHGARQKPPRAVGPVEVARAIGVDPGSYTRWEAGSQDPGLLGVAKAADFYGVSRAWLAWGQGRMAFKPDDVAATFQRAAQDLAAAKTTVPPAGRAARRKDG